MLTPLRRLKDRRIIGAENTEQMQEPIQPVRLIPESIPKSVPKLSPGLSCVHEPVSSAPLPKQSVPEAIDPPQALQGPSQALQAKATTSIGKFIDTVREIRARIGIEGELKQEFIDDLSASDERLGGSVSEEDLDLIRFPKDAPCVRHSDIGLDRVEWERIKHVQTVYCERHGIAKQVALPTCVWHKEEGDPACAAANCRHTSEASRRAFDALPPELQAVYEWRPKHSVVEEEQSQEEIAPAPLQEPVSHVAASDDLETFTPDGKIRKGSKYKRKSKVDANQMTMFWAGLCAAGRRNR